MFKFVSLVVIILATTTFAQEDTSGEKDFVTFIAIDLGTSYSRVGVFKHGRVEIIANDQGSLMTPSYVAFTADGERLIGDAAKNQLTSNPENTIFDVKRLIGRELSGPRVNGGSSNHSTTLSQTAQYWNYIIQIFSNLFWDPIVETAGTADRPDPPLPSVQPVIKKIPFTVINRKSKPIISVNVGSEQKYFEPEEISAMLLRKMRETAEAYLGYKVTHAVVTVPAYFNNAQRQATIDAATISGLNYVRLINEPTAAAIAYGFNDKEGEKNIVVFDLGGGTFDVSLLTIGNGVFEVVTTSGNTRLGGRDFDERVMEHFIELFKTKTGKDIRKDNQTVQKLRHEVDRAKRILSSQHQTTIKIASFYNNEDFNEILTRAKFEELNMDLFLSTLKSIQKVLDDTDLIKNDIAKVILVGGSTRIPKVQRLIKDYFYGKEPSCDINPDEAVVYGATVQAGVLSGKPGTRDIVLLDVNPLTMGIDTDGGVMSKMIRRNTAIPTQKSQIFSTTADNQAVVAIEVFEGEHPMTRYNYFLGKFDLTDIPPAPKGVPRIEVTFEVDINGILKVTAVDIETGKTNSAIVNSNSNHLSPDDIKRMIKDSERFAEEDKKVKYRVDAKNELESYVYSLKTQIADKNKLGGRLSSEEKFTIEKEIEEKIKWLDENQATAQVNDFITQKKFIEDVVAPIMAKLYRE
ncbi:unnamed protein product [Adineta steineri]|uniref:Uncharacterized protein n=1 Tax=Adineta steineri TaxID=433720 RepID=A0A813SWT1_9BILA|nr:unnamed protein product [Adineta steineri]CAF1494050.1 unnamed protein product [Adineta steineri]CAF4040623.1 unnamed protein product [Adineta steineri]CAF4085234.1 unnamed protein product [Adineta steineri]